MCKKPITVVKISIQGKMPFLRTLKIVTDNEESKRRQINYARNNCVAKSWMIFAKIDKDENILGKSCFAGALKTAIYMIE